MELTEKQRSFLTESEQAELEKIEDSMTPDEYKLFIKSQGVKIHGFWGWLHKNHNWYEMLLYRLPNSWTVTLNDWMTERAKIKNG